MTDVLVRTRALRKEFSGVPVLRDVDAQIRRGEILALIGENGAGKSTFMKILSGIYQATSGDLEFDGRAALFSTPAEARGAGVSIVPQEFNLAADLTVAENVFLGTELRGRFGLPDRELMRKKTAELLSELGANVSPDDRIENLSAAQKQLVEVCKALAFDAKLLILDEPTTVLTMVEIDRLFTLMRGLKRRGMTMVQFSSHAVFDGCKTGPYTEDDQPRPTGVYALTKYDAEVYASLCPRHYVVRIPTMFGPRRNVSPGFVDKMLALLRQGRELRVAADKIDSPTFSMDAARCLVAMLREGRAFGLYHVANEGAVSYFDFMTSLRDMAGYGNVIHPALDGDFLALAHKPLRTAMHSNKLPPMRPWRDALAAYLLEEGLAAQKPV